MRNPARNSLVRPPDSQGGGKEVTTKQIAFTVVELPCQVYTKYLDENFSHVKWYADNNGTDCASAARSSELQNEDSDYLSPVCDYKLLGQNILFVFYVECLKNKGIRFLLTRFCNIL